MGEFNDENAGVAFALVIAAGAATGIGAAVVFFPSLAKLANRRSLAASLGLAAGVMLYVSMVDIYSKAISGFEDNGHSEGDAFIYATLCFFAGISLMMVLNFIVGRLMGDTDPCEHNIEKIEELAEYTSSKKHSPSSRQLSPSNDINRASEMAEEGTSIRDQTEQEREVGVDNDGAIKRENSDDLLLKGSLKQMGFATALAIAIHNFPEGLVTFVAYMDDPAIGIVLAVGIGIHNIPEGLCVSMPLYYASGSRWKSFMWAILSGVSEPLGALFGYVVLKSSFSGNTYGVLFGLVSGIMAIIAVDELLPTAHRYDPENTVVTKSLIVGMAAIALSLMLFSV